MRSAADALTAATLDLTISARSPPCSCSPWARLRGLLRMACISRSYSCRKQDHLVGRRACMGKILVYSRYKFLCSPPHTSAVGIVSRVTPVHTALRNCTRDEGRPFEVGNQVLISSHRKLLSSKAMVVNVAEKSERDFGRYD